MNQNPIQCPRCGSNQVSANKRGWTITTGLLGSNLILITCLKCEKEFKPGHDLQSQQVKIQLLAKAVQQPIFWVMMIIIFGFLYWLFFIVL